MTSLQQQLLFDNTARAMGDAPQLIKQRHIDNCAKADPAYGAGVAKALNLSPSTVAAEAETETDLRSVL
jgi:catalase